MPELPDVEGFRGVMQRCAGGRRVDGVEVRDAGVLRGVTARRLRRELQGRRFAQPWRHGKWLVTPSDGPALVWHFGMTGELLCAAPDDAVEAHDRLLITLDGGRQLRYRDRRKLQGVRLAADEAAVERILADLGPDARGLDLSCFLRLLSGRRGGIKSALTDQSLLAGLGNLLADEILWRARVRPDRSVRGLDDDELRRVHAAMGRVLRSSVRAGRVPARRGWLTGRRDDAEPVCPRCGRPLASGRTAGRRTVWCEHCQR
ncbi:DNA-formamidopyrimidine glycosylase family protein [Streptomyces sp. MUM 178J]|uniref:DNA-formamidopyrimidine glycosylase family protein n=1 Tax=Streptomyces sp. MUM 178J TaxID=2791991 RepID=UPI001F0342E4|nr:DNA-formamidopyrimidine glycosylase family protein [Streptomyces sp. MUM 178J]WRQ78051.1 DNA-formamidopyrimidine glycosylase family protein [Streptomyces sp. MUM 178J]